MAINSVLFVQMDISRGIWCLLNDIFRSDRLSYSSHSPPFFRHLKYSVGDLWFGEWLRRRHPNFRPTNQQTCKLLQPLLPRLASITHPVSCIQPPFILTHSGTQRPNNAVLLT